MKQILLILALISAPPLFANFPIECEGRTEITYISPEADEWHKVTSYNPVEIDFAGRQIRSLSTDSEKNLPVQFKDPNREVYAKNLVIDFGTKGEALFLEKLTLFGHVKLVSQEKLEDESVHLQYALADRLVYTHDSEHLSLQSRPNSRVLYFDQLHNTRMSAPEITIRKNPDTGKPQIKGEGAVRFIFKEEELDKFRDHLSSHESK